MIEEEITSRMSAINFDSIAATCLNKISEHDPKKYGVIRVGDLKRVLFGVSYLIGLTESEIALICSKLPIGL